MQQRQRAINSGEYAAPVDIRHQNNRTLGHFRHSHIDDIAIAQIDFRRASGAFQHNNVIFLRQTVIDRKDLLTQTRFIVMVTHRIHIGRHFPHQHDLRQAIAGRFEQHRVHTHIWRDPRGFRLKNLRPPHLFTIRRNTRIKRHILRFKRRGTQTILIKNAA